MKTTHIKDQVAPEIRDLGKHSTHQPRVVLRPVSIQLGAVFHNLTGCEYLVGCKTVTLPGTDANALAALMQAGRMPQWAIAELEHLLSLQSTSLTLMVEASGKVFQRRSALITDVTAPHLAITPFGFYLLAHLENVCPWGVRLVSRMKQILRRDKQKVSGKNTTVFYL